MRYINDETNRKGSKAMRGVLVMLLALWATGTFAQRAVFKWSDELCEYAGTYDTRKYTAKQLDGCYWLSHNSSLMLSHTPSVFKPSDIDKLSIVALDQEYHQTLTQLEALDLPKATYWADLRQSKVTELNQLYQLSRVALQGYTNPSVLRQWFYQDTCLRRHVDALVAGGDSLLAGWRNVVAMQAARNGCPERLWGEFDAQRSSDSWMDYARVCITTFGWWNRALIHIERSEDKFDDNRRTREFMRLFVKTKNLGCDEP
jgi:hypothetical protein